MSKYTVLTIDDANAVHLVRYDHFAMLKIPKFADRHLLIVLSLESHIIRQCNDDIIIKSFFFACQKFSYPFYFFFLDETLVQEHRIFPVVFSQNIAGAKQNIRRHHKRDDTYPVSVSHGLFRTDNRSLYVILIFRLKAASLRFLFRSFFCSSVSLTVGLFFFVPAILFSPSTVHIFAAHLYLSFGCSIRLFHSSGVFDKALPLGS